MDSPLLPPINPVISIIVIIAMLTIATVFIIRNRRGKAEEKRIASGQAPTVKAKTTKSAGPAQTVVLNRGVKAPERPAAAAPASKPADDDDELPAL